MTPNLVIENSPNARHGDAELARQHRQAPVSLAGLWRYVATSYFANIVRGQLACDLIWAKATGVCAAFSVSVGHVVLMRSEKQVPWVYAQAVVAAVADVKAVWNWSIYDMPYEAMGGNCGGVRDVRAAQVHAPVAEIGHRTGPFNAIRVHHNSIILLQHAKYLS